MAVPLLQKKRFRKEIENLQEKNISKLNGEYSLNPIRRYYRFNKDKSNDKVLDFTKWGNAYDFLVNENSKKLDSLPNKENEYLLRLNLKNTKNLIVELLENSKIIRDTVFSGKYKKGMFYINNKYLDCNGIPFISGGCRNNKRRIGLTKSGNLIINEAVRNEGALLFIIGIGYSYNMTYEYERK